MRKAVLAFAMLVLAAAAASAQQELAPSTGDGPMNIKPVAPKAGDDGVYAVGPGVVAPLVIQRVPAAYPEGAPPDTAEGDCVLSMVVGTGGIPTDIQVLRSHGASFDAAATTAIRQSKFEPGTVNGKPVPVRMFARTRFLADMRPAYPRIMVRFGPPTGLPSQGVRGPMMNSRGVTPPRPITTAEPEFTDAARKSKIQGVVTVSVLVNEEGIPIDPQVVHSLEPGLDEKAIECALKYRFQPAMKEGVPVATRITIEMNFRLY
ncbi:MAG: energy transducer TonB [Terracidiphilus sp.]|nr:energy transducer TonB [Terracidiphilus sp.]